MTTISSGSDVPITQPLLLSQQQRVTSTGTLTDDLRPQSILKQQPPVPQPDQRSLYSSNKSLNDYNNGSVVVGVAGIGNNSIQNCQQHTPKCTPMRHDQESFTDNLRHASLITHSNSDLNQMCPHGKGSSKSKLLEKLINVSARSPTPTLAPSGHHCFVPLINKLLTRFLSLGRSERGAAAEGERANWSNSQQFDTFTMRGRDTIRVGSGSSSSRFFGSQG